VALVKIFTKKGGFQISPDCSGYAAEALAVCALAQHLSGKRDWYIYNA